MASAQADWLPLRRAKPIMNKAMDKHFMKARARKHHDWFMAVAWAMSDSKDSVQGKMLGKLYVFLRDYSPQGLVGRLGHIRGEDVMRYLLCSPFGPQLSRHKLTRNADDDFARLETWMENGEDWQSALSHARASAEDGEDRTYESGPPWKAPLLLSPANLLALLVVAHPDLKFKDRVGALQIDWMMNQPRDALDVREGYWKGLNAKNLSDVFLPEEKISGMDAVLLMDYTALFGEGFTESRQDIRPHLPPQMWAQKVHVDGERSDVEEITDFDLDELLCLDADDRPEDSTQATRNTQDHTEDTTRSVSCNSDLHGSNTYGATDGTTDDPVNKTTDRPPNSTDDKASSEAPDATRPELAELRQLFNPKRKTPQELHEWLNTRLDSVAGHKVLAIWCKAWRDRMKGAADYNAQLLVRSLFIQSLGRLHSFWVSSQTTADAYMVLDLEDMELRPSEPIGEGALGIFQNPIFISAMRASTRLATLVDERDLGTAAKDIITRITNRLGNFFYATCIHNTFFKVKKDVISLVERRTQLIIQDIREADLNAPRVPELLTATNITALQLTNWQLQLLLAPGAELHEVLTDTQRTVYQRMRAGRIDPPYHRAVTPQHAGTAHNDPEIAEIQCQLLGALPPPQHEEIPAQRMATPSMLVPRQSSHEGSRTASSPTPTGTIPGQNPFGGRKAKSLCIPAKRSLSPEIRETKARRVDMTLENLLGKLQSEMGTFAETLGQEIQSLRTENLHNTTQVRKDVQGFAEGLGKELQAFKLQTASANKALQDEVQTCKEECAEAKATVRQLSEGVTRNIKTLRHDVQAGQEAYSEGTATMRQMSSDFKALRDDIQASKEACGEAKTLIKEVSEGFKRDFKVMRDDVGDVRSRTEQLNGRLTSLWDEVGEVKQKTTQLTDAVRDNVALRESILACKDACSEVKAGTEALRQESRGLQNNIQGSESLLAQMSTELGSLESKVSSLADVKSRLSSAEATLSSLRDTQAALVRQTRPQAGQDGYLGQECTAPAGWDQKSYEAMLLQAAWSYARLFPSHGSFEADETALEKTKSCFPDAPYDHIAAALKHIHMQIYRKPFCVDEE